MAATFKPTPISWLDRQIYAITRAENYGNTRLGETNPVQGALTWYRRREAGGNPEIAELYRPPSLFTILATSRRRRRPTPGGSDRAGRVLRSPAVEETSR